MDGSEIRSTRPTRRSSFATIDRWVEREVAPRVKEFDHADRWPAELVEQMKELGLFGATIAKSMAGSACRRAPTPRS